MDTPSICSVSKYAIVMVILQYMSSYPSLNGNLFFLVEFVCSFFLLKRLYLIEVELRGTNGIIRDLKGRLRNECESHRQTKLYQTDVRLCANSALVNKKQEEISELKVKTRRELSEKETEILRTNRKLSETERDLEKLRTELVKSKDAERRLAQVISSDPYDRIARITETQKRLDVETQISFNKLLDELSEKETEIMNITSTLSKTQKESEKLRIKLVKSKDSERRLAQENTELYDRIARITETQKRLDVETKIHLNNLRVEFSEKETAIINLNRKFLETQKESESLRTELVESNDADSQMAQMNAELCVSNARITATRKRLDVYTQISLTKLGVELSEKKTAIMSISRTLSETKKELDNLRTELVKSKDAERRLAQMNAELCVGNARITGLHVNQTILMKRKRTFSETQTKVERKMQRVN